MTVDSSRLLTRTPTELLVAVSDSLLDGETAEARLSPMFRRAKRLLQQTAKSDVLEDIFGDDAKAFAAMSALVTHLDHVGIVLPTDLGPHLPEIARACGFTERHAWYPSVVVARELAGLASTSVPTKLFKAFTPPEESSGPVGFEAFVPEAPVGSVSQWVRSGVGKHLAFGLREPAFDVVTACFEAVGFVVPAFMEGRVIRNAAENISVMYYDTRVPGSLLRIECFHDARL